MSDSESKTLDPRFDRILKQREGESTEPTGWGDLRTMTPGEQAEAERKKRSQELDRAAEEAGNTMRIRNEAEDLYKSGKFIEFCHDVFRKIWYGDQHVLDAILLQAAALKILNISSGINLHIAGKTQSGKSDAGRRVLKFLPDVMKCIGTFSRQALYHSKKFHDEMIVFSDDTQFDPDTASIVRGVLTAWEEGIERETMVGKEWVSVKVPKRLNMILTSIESVARETDDGQDESRFLTLEIFRDPEAERMIRKFMQRPQPDITHEIAVIKQVLYSLPKAEIALHEEIERDLPFREFARFLTMIKASALLHNRNMTTDDDVRFVDVMLQRSRPMISSDIAGLTKNEKAVLEFLKSRVEVLLIKDIQKGLDIPNATVYRALRGKNGTFQNPTGGLLAKDRHVTLVFLDGSRDWGIQYV